MAEDDDTTWRRRRWKTLKDDGAVFGLTPKESAEIERIEKEFGDSGLAKECRS